jgi:hypothetical protein
MNIDMFYFKKDIVKTAKSFNELEKVRLNHKPTKKSFNFRSIKYTT